MPPRTASYSISPWAFVAVGVLSVGAIIALFGFYPDQAGIVLGGLIGLAIGLLIYFLPSIVAGGNKHPSMASILVINLFLGWTLVGWVVCLAWAVNQSHSK
jgi:hypothetical protein